MKRSMLLVQKLIYENTDEQHPYNFYDYEDAEDYYYDNCD